MWNLRNAVECLLTAAPKVARLEQTSRADDSSVVEQSTSTGGAKMSGTTDGSKAGMSGGLRVGSWLGAAGCAFGLGLSLAIVNLVAR